MSPHTVNCASRAWYMNPCDCKHGYKIEPLADREKELLAGPSERNQAIVDRLEGRISKLRELNRFDHETIGIAMVGGNKQLADNIVKEVKDRTKRIDELNEILTGA